MRLLRVLKQSFAVHTPFCVVGAGTGGINLSSHLIRSGFKADSFRIFDGASQHFYQPGWTMVGAGMIRPADTQRPIKEVIYPGVAFTNKHVTRIYPEKNTIVVEGGEEYTYDNLVLSVGIRMDWGRIKGLKNLIDDSDSNVCSIYGFNECSKVRRVAERTGKGTAIFTEPVMPIKCAGAPQKILYLLTDKWQKNGETVDVEFYKSIPVMFGVPKYANALIKVAKDYGIKTTFKHDLIEVTRDEATFMNNETKEIIKRKYDFLHAVPPMLPHSFVAESGLTDNSGYLSVDKHTLRHTKYPNIWGLGDCVNSPNAKTAAAVFSQTQVLERNFLALRENRPLTEKYEGYSSCPLLVGQNKLLLAQFKFDGVVDETFFSSQEKPRYIFYLLKRYLFPFFYWNFMPRGFWAGRKGIRVI